MAQILVRGIEDEVIRRLKNQAKQHHRSLQGEVKMILEQSAKMSMEEARATAEKWHKRLSGKIYSDSAELIREDRER